MKDENSKNALLGNINLVFAIIVAWLTTMLVKSITSHMTSYINWDLQVKDYFNHPILMNGVMFIGEFLCIPIFILLRYGIKVDKPDKKKPPIPPYFYSIPAFCDFLASGIKFIAYAFAAGSVIKMLQSSGIFWNAILSAIFLKKPIYSHQIVGIICCMLGVVCIGFSTSDEGTTTTFLGFLLCLIAEFIVAIKIVIEAALFSNYEISLFESVGYEGLFGIFYCAISFHIFQIIKMTQIQMTCDNHNQGPYIWNFPCSGMFVYERIEDFKTALIQL